MRLRAEHPSKEDIYLHWKGTLHKKVEIYRDLVTKGNRMLRRRICVSPKSHMPFPKVVTADSDNDQYKSVLK